MLSSERGAATLISFFFTTFCFVLLLSMLFPVLVLVLPIVNNALQFSFQHFIYLSVEWHWIKKKELWYDCGGGGGGAP